MGSGNSWSHHKILQIEVLVPDECAQMIKTEAFLMVCIWIKLHQIVIKI